MPQQRIYWPSCHLISHQSVSKTQLSTTFGQACCCCFEWVRGSCQASLKAPSQDRNHPSPAEIRTGVSRCSCHSCQLLALNKLWYNIWLRKRHPCFFLPRRFSFSFRAQTAAPLASVVELRCWAHWVSLRWDSWYQWSVRRQKPHKDAHGINWQFHPWMAPCCSSAHDSRAPTCRIACHPITSGTTAQPKILFAKWSFQHLSCCPSTETVDKPRRWLGDLRWFRLHIGLQLSDELQILPASSTCTTWTVRENFDLRVVTCTTNHPCPRRNQWIPYISVLFTRWPWIIQGLKPRIKKSQVHAAAYGQSANQTCCVQWILKSWSSTRQFAAAACWFASPGNYKRILYSLILYEAWTSIGTMICPFVHKLP